MESWELLDEYLAGVEALNGAVRGLGQTELLSRCAPGTWSILEVVCHLADSEALFAERMKRVLAEDQPVLLFADPSRFSAALAYSERHAEEEVAIFAALRRQMALILRAQPKEAWSRTGLHSKDGEQTLEQLARKAIVHLKHHLNFVWAKRATLARNAETTGVLTSRRPE